MKDKQKASAIASQRVQLVAPLAQEGMDIAQMRQLKEQICARTGLSDRTLRRYLVQYREKGYDGLLPKPRQPRNMVEVIPDAAFEQAVLLRRELPSRSVSQIIQILEWEKIVAVGQVKRSTLQDRFTANGYSSRHMRMYRSSGIATRRFAQQTRNALWQSDIKMGPYLPIGPNGTKKQVYLVLIIDDATRFIVHAAFYATMDQLIVEDALRQGIGKFGAPEAVFFDNGKQYRTKWMIRACSKMEIRLLYTLPYSPESKGKVERANRTVNSFLAEQHLEKPQTLDQLNKLLWVWMDECYQNRSHSSLEDRKSPAQAYHGDPKAHRFLTAEVIRDAFLHCEDRKVDKAGCINFGGQKYEAGIQFIGCKVQVVYDPSDTSTLTLELEGHPSWKASLLVIGPRTGPKPKLPDRMKTEPAANSRLLTAAAQKNAERREQQHVATSFRRAGGSTNV